MKVNRYQFDSIASKTKKTITPIGRGEEELYVEYLALIEARMNQFHLQYGINGRQAKEVLQLVLFDIKSITEQQEYDCSKWMEECYRPCADCIEELFILEKNPDLKNDLKEDIVQDDDFFELARKNIIRIHESVEHWTKELGANGYFDFISSFIGITSISEEKYLVEDRFLKSSKG